MAHVDARGGKWRGNWRIEWVASTLHTSSERGVSSITTADAHTSDASSRPNWPPTDLNGLVRFAERRNLVSARVPSHFNWPLPRELCPPQIWLVPVWYTTSWNYHLSEHKKLTPTWAYETITYLNKRNYHLSEHTKRSPIWTYEIFTYLNIRNYRLSEHIKRK